MMIVFNKAYTKLPIILHAIIGSFFWEVVIKFIAKYNIKNNMKKNLLSFNLFSV